MTLAHDEQHPPSPIRQLFSLDILWFFIRSPEVLALSLFIFGSVLAISIIVPQQPYLLNESDANQFIVWSPNLSPFYRSFFYIFENLGWFRIYYTIWFWLPFAWLVFVSLIVLGDQGLAILARLRFDPGTLPSDLPPHTSIHQIKHIHRLVAPKNSSMSADAEETMSQLKQYLQTTHYYVYEPETEYTLLAVRYVWRWTRPLLLLGGFLVISFGVIWQFLWGARDELVILTEQVSPRSFIDEQLISVKKFYPQADRVGRVVGGEIEMELNGQEMTWYLHHPHRYQGWWVIANQVQHTVRVQFIAEGIEIPPLDLIFFEATEKRPFAYPAKGLTFMMEYIVSEQGGDYRLRIIQATDINDLNVPVVQDGQNFLIPQFGLQGQVTLEDRLFFQAYRLSGFIFILIGLILFAIGLLLFIILPPSIVWFKIVSKGRGSWIEVEADIFRSLIPFADPLEQVLHASPNKADSTLDVSTVDEGVQS